VLIVDYHLSEEMSGTDAAGRWLPRSGTRADGDADGHAMNIGSVDTGRRSVCPSPSMRACCCRMNALVRSTGTRMPQPDGRCWPDRGRRARRLGGRPNELRVR
jgi:hypothetical protein